jgi:ribosomal protein S18 acetylase RimI-like enzyme
MANRFSLEPELAPAEFVDILQRSTLAERRPIGEPETIAGMLAHADNVLTARTESGLLIGVSRALTDYHYSTYLSDLAVDRDYQRQGIGRELIRRTHEAAGLATRLILLAAPAARSYYPHIGMRGHDSCWTIEPKRGVAPGRRPAG